MIIVSWRKITPLQKSEFVRREFFGNDVWVKWKQELDDCMIFRKSIKGKPTELERYFLDENNWTIKYLKELLYGKEFS